MKLIQHASQEKLNGGFYTPEVIVNFILKWAMNGNEGYDILEEIYPFMRTLQLHKIKGNIGIG